MKEVIENAEELDLSLFEEEPNKRSKSKKKDKKKKRPLGFVHMVINRKICGQIL
jgi:hypothetical protein